MGKAEKKNALLKAKQDAFNETVTRGKERDDAKAAAGAFFNKAKTILEIQNLASNWEAFFSTHLACAMQNDLAPYRELKEDIFGT